MAPCAPSAQIRAKPLSAFLPAKAAAWAPRSRSCSTANSTSLSPVAQARVAAAQAGAAVEGRVVVVVQLAPAAQARKPRRTQRVLPGLPGLPLPPVRQEPLPQRS